MAFDMITYSPTVPAYLKSVKTVDDVEVGGTLTCDKLIVTDDTRTNEGDLVIQQGDLILYESPAIPDPGERVDERKIVFNLGDPGLAGSTCEIGMKGGTNGVQGDIIFRCQTGTEVPGSTLQEVARFKGADLGIGTVIPEAKLDVAGDLKCETALISNAYTPGDFCPLAINAPGLSPTAPGQMFFEAGRSSSGANSGFSVLNFNHFIGNDGDKFPDPTKMGWRVINDTRSTADKFEIDSIEPAGGVPGRGRLWLQFDGVTGGTSIGAGLVIDNRPEVPSHYIRPVDDNVWNLGASAIKWKDIFSANPVTVISDRNQKKNITALPDNRGLDFINALTPVKYRFKQGTSNRFHYGLISQDVETLMSTLGDSDGTGNGMVVKNTTMVDDPDWVAPDMPEGELESTYTPPTPPQVEREDYGLRYEELIAPLIKAVQQLSARLDALE